MAVKIYLSPACHQYDNPCSAEKGCTENAHVNRYLDELTPYLDACGFEWKRNGKENVGSDGIKKAVAESNAWGADLHYVVHTNAFNGTVKGSRPMVYPAGDGKKWANVIANWRKKIYPYPITVKEKTDLYEINATKCVCVYEELVFHDNKEDATWLHNNLRVLAEYTARAFCEIFGVSFVDPHAREKGDTIYRVQVGAFSKRENAENMKEQLKKDGYDAIIVEGAR